MRVKHFFRCGFDDNFVFTSIIFYCTKNYPFYKTLYEWKGKMPDNNPETVNKFATTARKAAIHILEILKPHSKLYDTNLICHQIKIGNIVNYGNNN